MTPLEELAEVLDRVYGPPDAPVWVQAYGHAGAGGRLVVDDDLGRMFGWRAPSQCWAVGVVAGGRARATDGPAPAGDGCRRDDGTRAVRMVCLLDRDGVTAGRLHDGDGTTVTEAPSGGRVLDGLHRCLGLPTPAPERSTSELLALIWLAEVLAAAQADGGCWWDWPAVVALHPAVRTLHEQGCEVPIDHLDAVLRGASRAWSWERLRALAADGQWVGELVAPELAEWMDDGMFSRWLLDSAVPLAEVTRAVRRVLPATLGHHLHGCLRDLGLAPADPTTRTGTRARCG